MVRKCPVCQREFPNRAALRTHVQNVHPEQFGKLYAQRRQRQPNMAGQQASSIATRPNAPIAIGGPVLSGRMGDVLRLSGRERWGTLKAKAGASPNHIIVNTLFRPDMLPRLRHFAAAYERIRYHKLTFEIDGKTPTTTAGGYVCCFFPDPMQTAADVVSIMACAGSKSANFWEDVIVDAPVAGMQEMYTHVGAVESRWLSPGRFTMAVDASPSTQAQMTATVSWDVTLRQSVLEKVGTAPPILRAKTDLWSTAGTCSLSRAQSETVGSQYKDMFWPDFKGHLDHWYIAERSSIIEYHEGTGDTGSSLVNYIWLDTMNDVVNCYNNRAETSASCKKWQSGITDRILWPYGTAFYLWSTNQPGPPDPIPSSDTDAFIESFDVV